MSRGQIQYFFLASIKKHSELRFFVISVFLFPQHDREFPETVLRSVGHLIPMPPPCFVSVNHYHTRCSQWKSGVVFERRRNVLEYEGHISLMRITPSVPASSCLCAHLH